MPRSDRLVLIAGGGIGGLSAAIALARQGIASVVLERSNFVEEAGAGIQLGPNATRALRDLGALDAVEPHAFRPEAVVIFDGLSGKRLTAMPLGATIERRYGAPYLTLHRADLHAALLSVARSHGLIELNPRFTVAEIEQQPGSVSVRTVSGDKAEGAALIGADGLWSSVRKLVAPKATLRFARATASRALVARDQVPPPMDASPVVGLWLGPRAHLVHYPVQGGSRLNIVAVTAGGSERQGWNAEMDRETLHAAYASWCTDSKSLLESASAWRSWSLQHMPPLPRWTAGRMALLGDAAHPVLPYMAQGAALTIEDAAALASCFAASPDDPASAFLRYETLRRARAARVQKMSHRYGRLYHLGGALRLMRNVMLKRRSEDASLRRLDWLYKL